MEFREKVVMLTGAGKGVGRETAKHFAGAGARVGLIARTQRDIQSLEKEIRHSGGQAMALCCDISQEEQVDAAVKQLETAWGGVDRKSVV